MITKLKAYRADAEILGEIREVEYTGEGVVIHGLTLAEVGVVLELLSDKEIVGVGFSGKSEAVPVPAPPSSPERRYGSAAKVASVPVGSSVPGPGDKAQPERSKTSDLPPPPPPASPKVAAPAVVGVDRSAGGNGAAPGIAATATKLREIVDYLQAQGFKTVEAILAEIEKMRPASPVVQRATEIEARVRKMIGSPA